MGELRKTPLNDSHVRLGAKMVEFSGWSMPVYYSSVIDEHLGVRKKCGLFDVSHMGEFFVEGSGAFRLIQKVITNDLGSLSDGKAFYSSMCNERGGVVDDLFVYRFDANKFMLVVNAANVEKDFNWILNHKDFFEDATIIDKTDEMAKLDLQGPRSEEVLQGLTDLRLGDLRRFCFFEGRVNGIPMIVSRTGYTGEDGFELYFDSSKAVEMWYKLLSVGEEFGIRPVGLGARDTLRIEAGYSLYGHELSEQINPFEAGIGFAVKLDKDDFIGKEALSRAKEDLKRKIVAFEMTDRGIAREGYPVFVGGREIGYVSSGTMSPTFRKGVGMALIDVGEASLENEIHIKIREKLYKGKIVKRPIYAFNDKND